MTETAAITWQGAVLVGWMVVVIVMLLLLLQRAMFVLGLIAQAKEASGVMNDTFKFCLNQMGMSGKISLKISPNATSPAVCGLFRPVILVPQELGPSVGANQLRMVLLHELAHVKRGDLWVNLAQTLLQIVYFYNPFIWFANWIIRRIREQAVDEMVLVSLGEKASQYPETLVSVAKMAFKRPALSLRLIGVVESRSALSQRVKHMLTRPIPKHAKLGIAGLLAVFILGVFLLPMSQSWAGEAKFIVKGKVTDAVTGKPIAGAKVGDTEEYAGGKPYGVTDSNGNYSYLTWCEEHGVKAEAAGYKPKRETLLTSFWQTEKEKVLDFALEAGSEPSKIPAEFVGHWKGQSKIIVNWTKQQWLDIDIDIKQDGTVTGQVGDSQLKNGVFKLRDWLTRTFNPKSIWMVRGDLIGPVIKNENIQREYINLLFHTIGADGKITGGFHTSGSKIGNKETMIMSGREMVLEKVSPEGVNEIQKPSTQQFAAALPDGVTVELVAVCDYPGNGKRCWRADGSDLEKQIYVKRENGYSDGEYGFTVKVDGPNDLSFVWNKIEGSRGYYGSCKVLDESGNNLEGLQAAVIKGYDGRESTNIRIGISTEQWKTVVSHDGRSMTTSGNSDMLFSQAYESDGFVGITISSPWRKDVVARVIAIDKGNRIYVTKNIGSVASGEIDQMTAKFYGLKLTDIAKFQFQTRPYKWVEFKNVSLRPGQKTDVQVEVVKAEKKDKYGRTGLEVEQNLIRKQKLQEAFEHPEVIKEVAQQLFDKIRGADYDYFLSSKDVGVWEKFPTVGYYNPYSDYPGLVKWICRVFKDNPITSVEFGEVVRSRNDWPDMPYKLTLKDGSTIAGDLHLEYHFFDDPNGRWYGNHSLDWHLQPEEKVIHKNTLLADRGKPKIISINYPSGSEMAMISDLEVVFDQPMQPDQFQVVNASGKSDWFDIAAVAAHTVYDANQYRFTIPLMLPPNWNGNIKLNGFKNLKGIEAESVVLQYRTLQKEFSENLAKQFEKAAQSKEFKTLIEKIKNVRSNLKSLCETIHIVQNWDNRQESYKVVFRMQGGKQFYADISEVMKIPFIIGSDGKNCWFYIDRRSREDKEKLFVTGFDEISEKDVVICNPFDIAGKNVAEADKQKNLEYEGTETIDGRKCYMVRAWSANITVAGSFPNCRVDTWWIDAETYLPVKLVRYGTLMNETQRFICDKINEPIDDSQFRPDFVKGIEPQPPEPLGEGYDTRFLVINDGSENGRMSVRWGKSGSAGTSGAGLN